MRVAPRELRAVRRDGMLVRFAMLGPVAYVEIEVPPEGSAGSGLETPSPNEGWGFVLRGSATLHAATEREFPAGTAFHVPADDGHWFSATGRTVIAGFAPVAPDTDATDAALRRQGFEVLAGTAQPPGPLPTAIRAAEPGSMFLVPGAIEAETAMMGNWVFMRTTYGPMSGYTSGWCDVPHWGLVLSGDLALNWERGVELLTAGDVYYCPAGPPGHQFQVPDAATTIDYTPLHQFDAGGRVMEWRRAALRRAEERGAVPSGRRRGSSTGTELSPATGRPSTAASEAGAEAEADEDAGFAALLRDGAMVSAGPAAGQRNVRWVRGTALWSGLARGRRVLA